MIAAERRADRRAGVRAVRRAADLRRAATSPTTQTYERVAQALGDATNPVFYLEIPPSLFATVVAGLAKAGLTEPRPAGRDREAVRARPAVGPGAGRRPAQVPRRVPDLPDRPLPRQDGPRGDPLPALRQRDARAGLEPRRTSPRCRSRWPRASACPGPRALLRPGRRAARRRRQPPDADRRRGRDGAAVRRRSRDARRTPSRRVFEAICDADPAHCVRGQYEGYRRSTGSRRAPTPRPTSRCGWQIDNWRWSGVPFFIRTGKRMPVRATEVRLVLAPPAAAAVHPPVDAAPAGAQPDRVRIDPRHRDPDVLDAQRADSPGASEIDLDMEFAAGGRRGRHPLRGAAVGRAGRRLQPLHPPGRRRGVLADRRSRCSSIRRRRSSTRRAPGARLRPTRLATRVRRLARPLAAAAERGVDASGPARLHAGGR